ncbi:hypothetical protein [Metabacillus bambusae]|uniref:Uncharacterized protein n=1 Tax=Metabacillus bambusae TaxID=2795218 RepID=A0ABS3MZV6_9BACI|nr:hypothetical protein [Metabacillus bambusae]MBO1511542.1 hypothetical protein [Metabacillus bambusae]
MEIKKVEFMEFVSKMIVFADIDNPDEVDKKAIAHDILNNNIDKFKGYDKAIFYFRKNKKDDNTTNENTVSFILVGANNVSLPSNEKYFGSNGISKRSRAVKASKVI